MTIDRRTLLSTGVVTAGIATAVSSGVPSAEAAAAAHGGGLLFKRGRGKDQTSALQRALNKAARAGQTLVLPAGRFVVGGLRIPAGARMCGAGAKTVLEFSGDSDTFVTAHQADSFSLSHLTLDGANFPLDARRVLGLLDVRASRDVVLETITIENSLLNGMSLDQVSGRIFGCSVRTVRQAAIFSMDARGLVISHCQISDCSNNGILVWRQEAGHDGTLVSENRIERIATRNGGTGQNGNGVNVFRAENVIVSSNQIRDCAYSAVRGNAASNIQILGNSCQNIGEVALYSEFGFQGAVISQNVVDEAATGISVTNFNDGGRLSVVQGNLIRNLKTRDHEAVDKRGKGITVEADAAVTGNVIEGAPRVGIAVGWGPYMRNVAVTGNMVRDADVGIGVSAVVGAGSCLVGQNMIARTRRGAVMMMDHDRPEGADLGIDPQTVGNVTAVGNVVSAS